MRLLRHTFALLVVVLASQTLVHTQDPLPSWNDGPANRAILAFVKEVTDKSDFKYVAHEDRIATFDQGGTLWVEHPIYSQLMYCPDRVPVRANERPELKNVEPSKRCSPARRRRMAGSSSA
jgi:hypothetical protein